MIRKLLLLGLVLIFGKSYSQTIAESFELSKQTNKPLVIIRFDQGMVDYPKKFHNSTSDSRLDSLLNLETNKKTLENEYVIYKLEAYSLNEEEEKFLNNFVLDYTPNIIIFNPDGKLLHFYSTAYNDEMDDKLIQHIKDSIDVKTSHFERRIDLENEFESNQISNQDLLELIRLYHEIHFSSRKLLNIYAERELEITPELMNVISSLSLKSTDELINYILETEKPNDSNWPFFKLSLLQQLSENAQYKQDKEEFENVKKLKDLNSKRQLEKISDMNEGLPLPIFDKERTLESLNEHTLEENFNFYSSITDLENMKKYGELYANYLLKDYDKKKKEFIKNEMISFDWVSAAGIYPTDSAKNAEKERYKMNRPILLKNESNRYDEYSANALNGIAWSYYEKVNDKIDLNKALKWSKQSVKLSYKSALIDTYAHLYFKLGKIKKAIKIEKKALKVAKEEKSDRFINEFSNEILRFKKEPIH